MKSCISDLNLSFKNPTVQFFQINHLKLLVGISGLILTAACTETVERESYSAFLQEPGMLVNREQDNTVEGNYFKVKTVGLQDSTISVDFPPDFFINTHNAQQWMVGWGKQQPLYDAGVENLRNIDFINRSTNQLQLGKCIRGEGMPVAGQRVTFWNRSPSGFKKHPCSPVIDPSMWKDFKGSSIQFSAVVFDSTLQKWAIIVNECDTKPIKTYAATSTNLIDWTPANGGKPLFQPEDFKACSWAGWDADQTVLQTAMTTDLIRYKGQWVLFMDGYDKNGKRHIGIALSESSALGPYTIRETPILSPRSMGYWNDQSVFYGKIHQLKGEFLLFFDGKNRAGKESTGRASSHDLIHWKFYNKNPVIDEHYGWRSSTKTSEPVYVDSRNDSLFLLVEGRKKFKMNWWSRYISKRMYRDLSGNVDDAQIGMFVSTDRGKSFVAHKNNPVFVNDYSDYHENEHLGGNFERIQNDTATILFYQGKSSYPTWKYNIMMRYKTHH